MALLTPTFLNTQTYVAQRLRRQARASGVIQEGIVERGHFAVTQRGAGANMSVDVAAGEAWIKGDLANQGYYYCDNNAAVNVTIGANVSGNPRIDLIVLRVYDSADMGSGTDVPALEVVQGTPKAAATLANLKGAPGQTEGPAVPSTALPLAFVLVANGAATIVNANIGYLREPRAGLTGYPAAIEPKSRAGAPPPYAMGRPLDAVPSVLSRQSGQVLATGSGTEILFAIDEYDTEEIHSTAVNTQRFICKSPGLYLMNMYHEWGAEVGLAAYLLPSVNGGIGLPSNYGRVQAKNTQNQNTSFYWRLGYEDYIIFSAQQNSGGSLATNTIAGMTWQAP